MHLQWNQPKTAQEGMDPNNLTPGTMKRWEILAGTKDDINFIGVVDDHCKGGVVVAKGLSVTPVKGWKGATSLLDGGFAEGPATGDLAWAGTGVEDRVLLIPPWGCPPTKVFGTPSRAGRDTQTEPLPSYFL